MSAPDFSDIPYVHAIGDGGPRSRTQVVVIHATDNTASDEAEAAYATWREDHTSAHFYADEDSVIRGLPLDHIAYGCFPHGNAISVQLELCGGSNHITDATMRRVAPYVRLVCEFYGIPVVHLSPSQVRAGARGICGHDTITYAFPEDGGDHTDPGSQFPWDTFLSYVGSRPLDYRRGLNTGENDMPHLMIKWPGNATVFALFPSGVVRALGPGEFHYYTSVGVKYTETSTTVDEFHLLNRYAGRE